MSSASSAIPTAFTRQFSIRYPIIGAPMFLVSNVEIVTEVSNHGGLGAFPALNYRPIEKLKEALQEMRRRTSQPIGMNIIVNKSNTRQSEDLKYALEAGVELFITSLGNPKNVIQEAHKIGSKVYCDVTNLEHALKVQDLGADGVIAVSTGAGGHAGPISPMTLIPWLNAELDIPVIAAGGIVDGPTLAAALCLGAAGVSVGTRFIASSEAQVDSAYKQAIVNASPEDIVLTNRVSGTPASVINTEYVQKMGTDLPLALQILKKHPLTKKYVVPLIHLLGMKALEQSAQKPTWKTVWSAGQGSGLIHEILSCKEIMEKMVNEYFQTLEKLPGNLK